jgi:3-oxoacyl-[acyl-carrier protein] reductase
MVEAAGGAALAVPLDLADEGSITGAVRAVTAGYDAVDILVNNAVAWPDFPAPGERFETAPVEQFRKSLRANLEGHYLLTRALIGAMRGQGWGRVVHVSTGLVEDGMPGGSAYITAKSGLHGLTRTMARELARDGVLTNLVMPGFTMYPGRPMPEDIVAKASAAAATGRTTRPEDVASLIVFLCSEANGHVNGERIRVDGHFIAPL